MPSISRRDFIKMLGAGAAMLTMPASLAKAAEGAAQSGGALQAHVAVDPTVMSSRALNRRLFGKFAEHLGKNVYGGAWAQIVSNPDFVPIETWPDKAQLVNQLGAAASSHIMPLLDISAARGTLPPWWDKRGKVSVQAGEVGGRPTMILTKDESGTGSMVTPIYLPTHRVLRFVVRLRAQGPGALKVSLRKCLGGVELAATTITAKEWETHEITLELPAASPPGTPFELALEPVAGSVEARQCLLFPGDHLDGWDPDVVRYMRDAKLPLLRFPGGNFVSGYRWEDAIGPLEQRPVKRNTAWPIVEWNHVGTDEWLRLCELAGCEPLICVNAGDGKPDEAARWVEYCNGSTNTPMGALRAKNGHPEPYNVRYWEVGNELYGGWQIGHTDAFYYGLRYKNFSARMLEADPSILLIANGNTADWNRTANYTSGGQVRSFSHHALNGQWPANADPEKVYLEHMAHTPAYAKQWHDLTKTISEKGMPPRLAITEMQIFTQNSRLPNNATLTEALWTASIINEAIRTDGMVEMITHSALVNHGGGLRKDQEQVWAQPVWWVTHLYGTAGADLCRLDLQVDAPTFTVDKPYKMRTAANAPYLDVVGLSSVDGTKLVFFLVNRHPRQAIETRLELPARLFVNVEKATLTGATYMATNTRANPNAVRPVYERVAWDGTEANARLMIPPLSLVRLTLS